MIPCPYCEREFDKRAGLMRHVTATHHSEGVDHDVEVFDVDLETYAEALRGDEERPSMLADGQEPYVDPETGIDYAPDITKFEILVTEGMPVLDAAHGVTTEQYKRIRQLRREGHTEHDAWLTVVGFEPPTTVLALPTTDLPVRLHQVAFRCRNGWSDTRDAAWLLRLVEIGAEAIEHLDLTRMDDAGRFVAGPIIDRWNEAIR
jgi:hypothetical protein